jgi:tetratricopeptide (TPR) repeat protein
MGHIGRACLFAARGKRRAAREELERAERLDRAYALEYRAILTASPFAPPPADELRSLRAEIAGWNAPGARADASTPLWLDPHAGLHPAIRTYILGLLDAALGETASALARSEELASFPSPPESRCFVQALSRCLVAHAARADGDHERSLAILEGPGMETSFYLAIWSPFFSLDLERFVRADLLERAGRHEEALVWYGTFSENALADLVYLAPSDVRRGEILERLGRAADAAWHYDRFLRLWRDCDEELKPVADDVSRRLVRLRDGES